MADHALAENLRRLRRAQRLTQEAIAGAAGLSLAAYRKLEAAQSTPRARTLGALADALGVSADELLAPTRALRAVRFRSHKRLRTREQLLADVGRWLDDFRDVEDLLGVRSRSSLAAVSLPAAPGEDGRVAGAAAGARRAVGLDAEEPLDDLPGLLEANGVKVASMPLASYDFVGLSVAADDGGPAIVVNGWERVSVERRIFAAAQELGHLVLHPSDYDVGRSEEVRAHEIEANAFAAAFLMPESSFWHRWNASRGLALVDRVLHLKRLFRVSYRIVLFRVAERLAGRDDIWRRFQRDYARRFGAPLLGDAEPATLAADSYLASFPEVRSAAEPERLSRFEFTEARLARLVREAVEDGQISLGRGAEILRLPLDEMRALAATWLPEPTSAAVPHGRREDDDAPAR